MEISSKINPILTLHKILFEQEFPLVNTVLPGHDVIAKWMLAIREHVIEQDPTGENISIGGLLHINSDSRDKSPYNPLDIFPAQFWGHISRCTATTCLSYRFTPIDALATQTEIGNYDFVLKGIGIVIIIRILS